MLRFLQKDEACLAPPPVLTPQFNSPPPTQASVPGEPWAFEAATLHPGQWSQPQAGPM